MNRSGSNYVMMENGLSPVSHDFQQIGLALTILVFIAGLIGMAFWFFTTEVFSIRVSSGQWWFFLVIAALMVFLAEAYIIRRVIRGSIKAVTVGVTLVLMAALVYLGMKHKPFAPGNLKRRIGLVPAFEPRTGAPVEEISFTEYTPPVDTLTHEENLPPAIDQGNCGSCWAVASAIALSARYKKYLKDMDQELPMTPITTCAPAGVDAKDWFFSPQYILDRDEAHGQDQSKCLASSYGQCNGNDQIAGFLISQEGVPSLECVPYYAGDSGDCNTECGAPESEFLSCPENKRATKCIQPEGIEWSKCKDGSELKRTGQAYDVKYVKGEATMIRELVEHGPILCGINFYYKSDGTPAAWTLSKSSSLWGDYTDLVSKGYVVRPTMDGDEYRLDFNEGGHALVVYGFGEHQGVKYWNVRNTWGDGWGVEGNSRIERGINAWNIESLCGSAKVREYSNDQMSKK